MNTKAINKNNNLFLLVQIFSFSSILLGPLLNSFFQAPINYILVFFALFFYFIEVLFNSNKFIITYRSLFTILVIILINFFSYLPSGFSKGINFSQALIPMLYAGLVTSYIHFDFSFLQRFLRILLYFSFFVGILDVLGFPILGFAAEYQNVGLGQTGSIFLNSKAYGSFLLTFTIFNLKKTNFYDFICLVISFIICGSRAPLILFIALLISSKFNFLFKFKMPKLIIKNKFLIKGFISFNNLIKQFLYLGFLSLGIKFIFDNKDYFLLFLRRSLSLFTGTYFSNNYGNFVRTDMFNKHLNCFGNYDIYEKIFGNSGYCPVLIGNGSENFYLDILTNGGISISLILLSILIYLAFKYPGLGFFIVILLISGIYHRMIFDNYLGFALFILYFKGINKSFKSNTF